MRIADVSFTGVAVPILAPRLHADGVTRQVVRTLIEVRTDDGLVGLGEVGVRVAASRLEAARRKLLGEDPFATERLRLMLCKGKFPDREANILFAGVEMACLDIQGKVAGRPVCDLLGGRVRDSVPTIAYVFRLQEAGDHAGVRTPDEVVAHTRALVEQHGFRAIKFKAGSASWREDVETTEALASAFPAHDLRVDPNAIWSLETALRVAGRLRHLDLEFLEDPVLGLEAMAEVTRRGGIPTATNMCLTDFHELPRAAALHAVDVVLLDLYYLGGLVSAKSFAQACDAWKIGLGIHSGGAGTSELGVATAAMLHLASSLPYLVHAADSMYHHQLDDILKGGMLRYHDGAMRAPEGPGLGVELDPDKVGIFAEAYARWQETQRRSSPSFDQTPVYPAW